MVNISPFLIPINFLLSTLPSSKQIYYQNQHLINFQPSMLQPTPQTQRYQRLSKIGQGTYGVVYRAKDKLTNQIVALKKIRLEHQDEGIPSTAVREISLLKGLQHPNVICLKDVICSSNKLNLIFEFVETDLKKYLEVGPVGEEGCKKILYQLLLAVDYCHANRIIHRDLKPQNILIDRESLEIKLADFGLARTFYIPLKEYTHEVVTLWYRAPEILLGKEKYSTSVDVWSLGCIFYELAHKKILFCGDSEIDQLFKIFNALGTPREETWPGVTKLREFKPTFPKWTKNELSTYNCKLSSEGMDLLEKMLRTDPAKRITCLEALEHQYFNTLDKEKYAKPEPLD